MKKHIFVIVLTFVIIFVLGVTIYLFRSKYNTRRSSATSTSSSITSQGQWVGGTNSTLLDTATSPGDIKINVSGGVTQVDTSSASVSAEVDGGNAAKVIDGNDATGWGFGSTTEGECHWWKMDLGSTITDISRVTNVGGGEADSTQEVLFSTDDAAYTSITTFSGAGGPFEYNLPAPQDARYVKINACNQFLFGPGDNVGENELRLYQGPYSATNVETIDGGENFWSWDSFADSKTTPANTSVTYRYRTSNNGTEWTA